MSPTSYLTAPPRVDLVWTCDCTGRSARPPTVETSIDLSDAMDTAPIDLRHEQSDWAATA